VMNYVPLHHVAFVLLMHIYGAPIQSCNNNINNNTIIINNNNRINLLACFSPLVHHKAAIKGHCFT
jgi:hypothetical protein